MSQQATVLAFDLGASSGRAYIGEYHINENGTPRLDIHEIHRFVNEPVQAGSHLYWDILRLLQEVKNGLRKAFQAGFHPAAFGIDTWGVDFGLLDANGELLGNPYHYRDPRTEGLIEEVNALVGKETLYAESGLQQMPFNTIYQLYAMVKAKSPKLQAARTLLLTPDLLVYMLTGQRSCEYTMATTTQLFHPQLKQWNKPLMDRLGIPSELFLEPVQPGERIGALTEQVCKELGISPMEAIAVGTHDTESAVVAVPAIDKAFVYLVCGTWSLLGTELEHPLLTKEAQELDYSNEGGVGGTYQLLKNIMGLWILQECKREWDDMGQDLSYPDLIQLAKQASPFRSLIHPDDQRFYGPGGMIQKIKDYCKRTNQAVPESYGEIVRCVLESLALRYRQAVEQVERLTGQSFKGIHMVGGGIQNELLCQFTADALGRPVWAGPIEASAIGNLAVQLISLGHCKDLVEVRRLIRASFDIKTFEPAETNPWQQAYNRFIKL